MSNVPQESSFFWDKVWDIDIILYISGGKQLLGLVYLDLV